MISVVIRTIGRPSLNDAIKSALREFDEVIVVADSVNLQHKINDDKITYLRTGRKFDKYGSAALNMGACAVSNEYFCLLDDDDEFVEGAGDKMKSFITANPHYDIVIPGIKFNDGNSLCVEPGLRYGNVAVPTFKTRWVHRVPMTPEHLKTYVSIPPDAIDLAHVARCADLGARVGWYGEVLYLVRPKIEGTNGRGV
jgi:glycosyltransferase involved in cell wall biosynthesis